MAQLLKINHLIVIDEASDFCAHAKPLVGLEAREVNVD